MAPADAAVAAFLAAGSGTTYESLVADRDLEGLLALLAAAESARAGAADRYRRVRASALAAALCRFALQDHPDLPHGAPVPVEAWEDCLQRRFARGLATAWAAIARSGHGRWLISLLGGLYHLAQYDELAAQVRASVRESRGNRWLFRGGRVDEHPLRIHPALLSSDPATGLRPLLAESVPVRLDLSHSGWSDIFFLAMDRPEGARVLNISVALAGPDGTGEPEPPITGFLRVLDEPVLRLTAIDLGETADCADLAAVFDFGADHLGLLKAAVVAAGAVPPAMEGSHQTLADCLAGLVGPGRGLEVASRVAGIPKGSRLAVSTNLLAGLVALVMRATRQTGSLTGPLSEEERRVAASRAILGEWLGGSGGGWQDSGGLWPGFKVISGEPAVPGDPEHGAARGRLLPRHRVLDLSPGARAAFAASLVVFHGGMSANVGPVLEMVTTAHLLRRADALAARLDLEARFPRILAALEAGDVRTLAREVHAQFRGPLAAIIPGVTNDFTEAVIAAAEARWGAGFWGFCMLGGMSGGGMAMFVDPGLRDEVLAEWPAILRGLAEERSATMPFAVAPVVYRVAVDGEGSRAALRSGRSAHMPGEYYRIHAPALVRSSGAADGARRRDLLGAIAAGGLTPRDHERLVAALAAGLAGVPGGGGDPAPVEAVRRAYGFDHARQEELQTRLRGRQISLAANILPAHLTIDEVPSGTVMPATAGDRRAAAARLAEGRVAVVTMAGGLGTRWTGGAGVVKGLSPFVRMDGRFRSFLELHLRRTAREAEAWGAGAPQAVTTSFLTRDAIAARIAAWTSAGDAFARDVLVGRGSATSQRVVPMVADLEHWLRVQPRPRLDELRQKAMDERDRAWIQWARQQGEGTPWRGDSPAQALNPPGHWWELPNLLLDGTLARLLATRPGLGTILLRNIDTLGAGLDPGPLAAHLAGGAAMTVEVVERLAGDAGGALAAVEGRARLIEGLALPDERLELRLRWYNTNTCWIEIDPFLALLGLDRASLGDAARVRAAVHALARRMPTYVTMKQVQRRWGNGQVDVLPVAQFEQLWGDMTALADFPCAYVQVPRRRGQQLKDVAQLDGWLRDGSAAEVAAAAGLCLP